MPKRVHKVPKTKTSFKTILMDLIDDPERPIRSDLSPESVEDLAQSIKSVGLIEPLVVKPIGERYELLVGHRRLLACEMADLLKVPCYVMETDKRTGDLIKLHENIYRQGISPLDEAKYLAYLKKQYKLTGAKIATLINRSDGYVSDRLKLLKYPKLMMAALEEGAIGISVARELMMIDDVATRNEYLKYAIKSGITYPVAAQWRRDWQASRGLPVTEKKVSKEIIEKEEIGTYKVKCGICRKELPLNEAQTIYVHPQCYDAVKV